MGEVGIGATVVQITPTIKDLSARPDEWKGAASEFAQTLHSIQERMGAKTLHIFVAVPSVLAFAWVVLLEWTSMYACIIGSPIRRAMRRF